MAKRIVDEEMKFDIIVNGDDAKKELYALEKGTRKLTEENKALSLQKKQLEKQNKQETEEYKNLTATMRANSKEIRENKSRMAELTKQIGINGLTMGQLSKEATRLKLLLHNMVPGSADHQRYSAELKQLKLRMDELNGKAKETKLSLSSMADGFNKYAALGASVIAMLTGVVLSIQKIIDINGKLAGAQTNVMKTTGMSRKEVDELTKSFGLLESRTSRINLLKIAEVGGLLNIPKDEIFAFVKVMDKASVALGDSFEGGAEQVANKLGIIKGLFEETKNAGVEESFESIGSSLNDLGAAGAATEQNIADFMTRVGTLPENLKPSIATAAGLGAAFEESGLKAEIAGNNYGKVISIAARDTAAFAKVLKRPVSELENLINTDPTEFFLQFAGSLKDLDATDLAKVLDYLKLNDNEVKMVLGAAANNVDLFRDKIRLSGESMKQATSLTNEYNIKNNDLEATLEKIKKRVTGWFSSDGFVAFLAASVEWFGKLIGATDDANGSGQRWRNTIFFIAKAIAVVSAALVTNLAWMKLTALWTSRNTEATLLYNLGLKARAVAEAASIIGTRALVLVHNLLTLNIRGAAQAFRALTAAMATTGWGAILALVAACVTAYLAFSDSATKASRQQKIFSDLAKEVESSVKQEVDALNIKLKLAQDINQSDAARKKAIQDIIAMSPEYLEGLTLENINTAEGKKLIDEYVNSLKKAARAKAVQSKITELYSQMLEVEQADLQENVKWYNHLWNAMKSGGNAAQMAVLNVETGIANRDEAKKEIQEVIDDLLAEQANEYKGKLTALSPLQKRIQDIDSQLEILRSRGQMTSDLFKKLTKEREDLLKKKDIYIPEGDEDKAAAKAKEKADREHEQRMKDLERQKAELRELQHKAIDAGLELMDEGFAKEQAKQEEQHRKKLEDLKAQMIKEADFKKADENINSPKSSKRDVMFWTDQKQVWVDKNKHLNELLRLEEQTHYSKMGTLLANEYTKQQKKLTENYERQKTIRETNYLGYLNSIHTFDEAKEALRGILTDKQLEEIKTLEQAKKALKEDFDKQELEREIKHIDDAIAQMNAQMKGVTFYGMDITLLTPEQKEKIQKEIEFLALKGEQARAALSGKNDNKEGSEADKAKRNGENKKVFENFNGGADILGFTPDQWESTFNNLDTLYGKMNAGAMVVQALQNMWGTYDAFMTSSENNRLKQYEKNAEVKKNKLKWQLDNGYINQVQFKRGVEKLEDEAERKKADIEYKQAKRKKAIAIADTIINTAVSIMQAFSQLGPIGGAIAAVMLGAMGVFQVATISQQPLPARGYEEGLYPEYVKREQDGKIFKSTYGGTTRSGMVKKPTYFLTGENGPEMIIDNRAYRGLSEQTRNALERELRGIKGWEQGYYNDNLRSPRYEVPAAAVAGGQVPGNVSQEYLLSVINRNTEVMERMLDEGIIAYMSKDPRQLKKFQEELDRIEKSRTKAQV